MKKIMGILLAISLILAAGLSSALADVLPFGDFSMDIDPEMAGEASEKKDSEVMVTLYPAYRAEGDSATNFNVVWTDMNENPIPKYRDKLETLIPDYLEMMKSGLQAQGVETLEAEVLTIEIRNIGGREAIWISIREKLDYSGLGDDYKGFILDVYQVQAMVYGDFGCYAFTGSAASPEKIEQWIQPLFDSITWN